MKFFTVKIREVNDGTQERDLRSYDTVDDALSKFHADLAKYIQESTTDSILEMIVNSEGGVHKCEKWVASSETTEE